MVDRGKRLETEELLAATVTFVPSRKGSAEVLADCCWVAVVLRKLLVVDDERRGALTEDGEAVRDESELLLVTAIEAKVDECSPLTAVPVYAVTGPNEAVAELEADTGLDDADMGLVEAVAELDEAIAGISFTLPKIAAAVVDEIELAVTWPEEVAAVAAVPSVDETRPEVAAAAVEESCSPAVQLRAGKAVPVLNQKTVVTASVFWIQQYYVRIHSNPIITKC